jgi:hypothetical protein
VILTEAETLETLEHSSAIAGYFFFSLVESMLVLVVGAT